ncbi:hypothetical protein HanPI659440_Chr14g0561951 [Helianthus annuus]|nr:hypothetical protein HanPI659440_Chr14g0561951 [Helianthus annuus]
MKWPNLVNLSTTTMIESLPCTLGSPPMKSMEISEKICFGTGKGCSKPGYATFSDLVLWQTSQVLIKCLTCLCNPFHLNIPLIL